MAKPKHVHFIFKFSLQNTCVYNMHSDWLQLSLAAST